MEKLLHTKKTITCALFVIICIAGLIVARLALDQWQGYYSAQESFKDGDYKATIMYYDRVLNAHIPFSPFESKVKSNLLKLADKLESDKEYELSLLCYETIRTSRYLSRHLKIPHEKELSFLNDKIAAIRAQLLTNEGMAKDYRAAYTQQIEIMKKDYSPSVLWSFLSVVSLGGYIGFIVMWILQRKKGYAWALGVCLVMWMTSLYMA